jgi:hypothetical protein
MKAEERHKMKTNDLAESIEHLPDYLRTHGPRIAVIVVAVLVVGIGWLWWSNSVQAAKHQQVEKLHELLVTIDTLQGMTAYQSRQATAPGQDTSQAFPVSYSANVMLQSLGELAEQAKGTPVAATAILQQAEVMRSELLYAGRAISANDKQEICNAVKALYEHVIELHSGSPVATGAARMGLGLVAEELGNWDQARDIYQKLASETNTPIAATAFPAAAKQRLADLDSLSEPLAFAPAKAIPVAETILKPDLSIVPATDLPSAPQE